MRIPQFHGSKDIYGYVKKTATSTFDAGGGSPDNAEDRNIVLKGQISRCLVHIHIERKIML